MIDRKIICKSVPETVASRPSPDVCSREGDQHQDCACGTVISGNRATSTSATTPPIGACSPGAPTTASWRRRGWSGWRSTCRATPAGRRTPSTARRRSVSGSQPAMQRHAVTFPAAEVSSGRSWWCRGQRLPSQLQKCLRDAAGDAEARGYLPSCRSVSGTAPCRTTTRCSTSRSACCCRSSSLSCATVCLFVCLSVTYMHTYIHTYLHINIAPKIVKKNPRRWHRMTRDGKGRLEEIEFWVAFKGG